MFNIRVYGILINEQKEVLITDELRFGKEMTKFPGGGLQFGEGTIDCLKREFREELGCEIEVLKHFYTTDFFQPSAFHEDHQLISIYYIVAPLHPPERGKSSFMLPPSGEIKGARWVSLSEMSEDDFTFPIDKKIAGMLRD